MIHTVKGFGIVNETEREVFMEFPSLSMIHQILAVWSLSPLPFLKWSWTSGKFLVCITLNWTDWRRQWHPTPVLLPRKFHGQRSLVGCSPWGLEEWDMTEWLHFHFSFSCIGEGNGNPLQCSCLENPRDGGAWWVAVYGVAQSRTWLKWLSSRTELNWSPACKILSMALPECTHQCNCPMLWTFFSTTLLGNLDEDWHFPVLWWERNDTWFLIDIVYLLLPTLSIHHCIEQETHKQKTVDFLLLQTVLLLFNH